MSWTPTTYDYADLLLRQNPWNLLHPPRVPEGLAMRVERKLSSLLTHALLADRPHRFHLVLGPRRVGKTTVMYQVVRHLLEQGIPPSRLWWIRLDHPLLLDLPLGELVEQITGKREASPETPVYVFLDELTYSARWDLWLKTFYDEGWPLRLVGTSSSTAALQQGRRESGVGRWDEQYLTPWLFSEYLRLRGKELAFEVGATLADTLRGLPPDIVNEESIEGPLLSYLFIGGYPELVTGMTGDLESDLFRSQQVLRTDAVERAVYKDIPQAFGVHEPVKLERLLYLLAGQLGGILSAGKLAADLGLTQPTVDQYLRYLEQAYIVFLLPNYAGSEEAVQRRGRKLFFLDGALRNAALQRGVGPLRDDGEMGLLRENAVAAHLQALAQQSGVRLYHWREGRDEVDLLLDHPEHPLAFEVASSASHSLKGLRALQRRHPRFAGRCYLVHPGAIPAAPERHPSGIGRIPLALLLATIGLQAEREQKSRLTGGRG